MKCISHRIFSFMLTLVCLFLLNSGCSESKSDELVIGSYVIDIDSRYLVDPFFPNHGLDIQQEELVFRVPVSMLPGQQFGGGKRQNTIGLSYFLQEKDRESPAILNAWKRQGQFSNSSVIKSDLGYIVFNRSISAVFTEEPEARLGNPEAFFQAFCTRLEIDESGKVVSGVSCISSERINDEVVGGISYDFSLYPYRSKIINLLRSRVVSR